MSKTGKLKFLDESASVNKESKRLIAYGEVDTIIVLSHAGYEVDKQIAAKAAPKIGLIVGGHSHTFLYSGNSLPGPERPQGPYPTVIKHEDGRNILVVQASAYTKYLGDINIYIDANGNITNWSGAPIYLKHDIPQDKEVNKLINKWKVQTDAIGKRVLGVSKVELSHKKCRYAECNLGNFITDAMVFNLLDKAEEGSWTYAAIGIINAGGIRTSIGKGNITYSDLSTSLPFHNTVDICEMQGKYIKELMEIAADQRQALQVSGLIVTYNLKNPSGSRVVSIQVRCRECPVPMYKPLDDNKIYRIAINSFLGSAGGDGFGHLLQHMQNYQVGEDDLKVAEKYVTHQSPIIQGIDGRIKFL